jgi:hypothetical protein
VRNPTLGFREPSLREKRARAVVSLFTCHVRRVRASPVDVPRARALATASVLTYWSFLLSAYAALCEGNAFFPSRRIVRSPKPLHRIRARAEWEVLKAPADRLQERVCVRPIRVEHGFAAADLVSVVLASDRLDG